MKIYELEEKEIPWGMLEPQAKQQRQVGHRPRGGEKFKRFYPAAAGALARNSARLEDIIDDLAKRADTLGDIPEEFKGQKVRFLTLVDKLCSVASKIK